MTRTTRKSLLRPALCALLALLLASGCAWRQGEGTAIPDTVDGIPKAANRMAPSTLPIMTTPGTWLREPRGPLFEPMDTLDPRNAMVYVYRPSTSWEDQELQAPSFFVDGRKVFGVKSGSYTWLELHAGTYQFYAKRPLSILFIKKIFEMQLKVAGGRNYYLRYSEDAPFDYKAEGLNPDDFMQSGYLQEVPESIALVEIAALKLDHPGMYLASGRVSQPRWVPFDAFPETGVDPDDVPGADGGAPAEGWWSRTRSWFGNLF